ncbi:MAG: YdcF family protein [Acidobacteria bacterium]|nr:YdcF family protein [Acidobacteriota bacterium]
MPQDAGAGALADPHIRTLVETIWNYHRLGHALAKSDVILVLCSHDTIVAERGAELFQQGWAPLLIFSGGLGAITRHFWSEPEANQFAALAVDRGVPRDRILIENRSTNTGENVWFTKQLLAERGLDPQTFIVVQKPYMERRSYATFKKVWPGKDVIVTSPQLSMDEYLARYSHETLTPEDVVSIMVGDLQRIQVYPAKGFQIPQEIPPDVRRAYEQLIEAGFDRHLIADRG